MHWNNPLNLVKFQAPFEDFIRGLLHCLVYLFHQDFIVQKAVVERCLNFVAKFCADIAIKQEIENSVESDDSDEEPATHPLLTRMIFEAKKVSITFLHIQRLFCDFTVPPRWECEREVLVMSIHSFVVEIHGWHTDG